jgi:hypothetical protein
MTVKALNIICKEIGIKGYSRKDKSSIIEMIMQSKAVLPITEKINNDAYINLSRQVKAEMVEDKYTKEILKEQYALHKSYFIGRLNTTTNIGIKVRMSGIPEDISENIIKHIINNKLNDKTSRWNCNNGDLQSEKEGIQECKCFTSDGPLSFTPSSHWDVIYFLDARKWLDDNYTLYRIPLKRTSEEWKNIKMNKIQTFEDQTNQGRRPRINWESLYPQIESHCNKVYEGNFEDIFIPLGAPLGVME